MYTLTAYAEQNGKAHKSVRYLLSKNNNIKNTITTTHSEIEQDVI